MVLYPEALLSTKCVNNLITAICFMATAEGLVIGKRLGLDPEAMIDTLNISTGMSWNSINHFKQRIFNRQFDDKVKLNLMIKDIGIAMKLAAEQKLDLPLFSKGRHLWETAGNASSDNASISEMVRWVEKMTKTNLCKEGD